MPKDKNLPKNQYSEYSGFLDLSIYGNKTAGNNVKDLKNLQYYLKKLNAEISKCYIKDDQNQYKPIGRDRLKKIKDLYKLCDFYASKAEQKAKEQNATGTLVSQLHKILKEDEAYVSCLTEKSIFPESFRRNIVTLNSADLKSVGFKMSSRNPITYTDESGKKVSGFFTGSSSNNKYEKDLYIKHRQEVDEIKAKLKHNRNNRELNDQMDEKIREREENPALLQTVVYGRAGIEYGNNITDRNCAMTRIANLLGLNELLAESHPMTVYDEQGTEKKGVFMSTSNGTIYENLLQVPAYKKMVVENKKVPFSLESPTLKKNLADMQILDYICGNVDRHQQNMTYIFDNTNADQPQLIGIQGIDNDLSMGTINPVDRGIMNLPALKKIRVISESLAAKIKNMKQEELEYVLKGLDLTEQEIAAAWQRTTEIKQRLERAEKYTPETHKFSDNYITIIPDRNYEDIYFNEFCSRDRNYFDTVKNIPAFLKNDYKMDKAVEEKLPQKLRLNYEPKQVPYAEARLNRLSFTKEVIDKNKDSFAKFKQNLENLAINSETGKVEIKGRRSALYTNVYEAVDKLRKWYETYDENSTDKKTLKPLLETAVTACRDYIRAHNPYSEIGKQRQKAITDIIEFIGTQGIMINEYHEYVDRRITEKMPKAGEKPKQNTSSKNSVGGMVPR